MVWRKGPKWEGTAFPRTCWELGKEVTFHGTMNRYLYSVRDRQPCLTCWVPFVFLLLSGVGTGPTS